MAKLMLPLSRRLAIWRKSLPQPLDGWAIALMVVLAIATALLMLLGDHSVVRVQQFSWQEATVGRGDRAFILSFNRPMDPDSVEEHLTIVPPLPGRTSWAGRRMAYTLDLPIPYGESFRVELSQAWDRFSQPGDVPFEPFQGRFRSRDRAFAYLGEVGEEAGRLVLVNLSKGGDRRILTPPDLQVLDFQPFPLGDRILFSAIATGDDSTPRSTDLYQVTTGLRPQVPIAALGEIEKPEAAPGLPGQVTLLLGGDGFQTLAFDLAPNGRRLVAQRVNLSNTNDFGPWVLELGREPRPLATEPGGEFVIAPDSLTLLMLQGQGTAVIPLDADQRSTLEPLDFLPEFGRVFDLTSNGLSAAMVDFNQNDPNRRFTESLVLVNSRGDNRELLTVEGAILDAQFDPSDRLLYTLTTTRLADETLYQEQATLSAINLDSDQVIPLLTFAPNTQVNFNLAPDGLGILLSTRPVRADDAPVAAPPSRPTLWFLPLFSDTASRIAATPTPLDPQPLTFTGDRPRWLP